MGDSFRKQSLFYRMTYAEKETRRITLIFADRLRTPSLIWGVEALMLASLCPARRNLLHGYITLISGIAHILASGNPFSIIHGRGGVLLLNDWTSFKHSNPPHPPPPRYCYMR